MKIVFCGTPAFAVRTLEVLAAAGHEIALVIAQPDRPAGRGLQVQTGAVKAAAQHLNLPVVQPDKIRNNTELRTQLEQICPDAIVVVAYGRIIPDWMLTLPRFGCINLHGSLLPKYRGAAPIQWAIAEGETCTGVTTMRLDSGLDTGPMLLAERVPIAAEETAPQLFEALAQIGAPLVVKTLARLLDGTLEPVPQDHAAATHARILTREDGRLDFSRSATKLFNRWRGFQPWPGAFTTLRGKKLNVHRLACDESELPAGTLHVDGQRLLAGCAQGSLELLEVQIEGKQRMSAAEFLRGYQIRSGEQVGQ